MRRLAVLLLALAPAPGLGQGSGQPPSALVAGGPPAPRWPTAGAPVPAPEILRTPAGAFTASLILPGAGQAALGLRRWFLYGALEVAFWAVELDAGSDVRRLKGSYRDLAWNAARLPTGPGQRVDGSWGYYETIGHYVTSGAYDLDPGTSGVQPEDDETTYNGYVWSLARGLFLPGGVVDTGAPEYTAALAYYRDHAAGPGFLWDWSGRPEDMARYGGLIQDADDAARTRSMALGLVLANHLVAAADALVVARLRGSTGIHLESRLSPTAGAPRWDVSLRISLPD